MDFHTFKLPKLLLKALQKISFTRPTPIQKATIPLALSGKDILGVAQTGTGKTGAFAIPLAANLLQSSDASVLVLTPTRELAVQVMDIFRALLSFDNRVRTALLIGGVPMHGQLRRLKGNPRLIVGTPGRINDHIERGTLSVSDTKTLVLDEMDLMLNMGFDVQVERIVSKMKGVRQRLMFSATLPKRIAKIADKYLKDPAKLSVGDGTMPRKDIEQVVMEVGRGDKYKKLATQLDEREGGVIIFVRTRLGADRVSMRLSKDGYACAAMHGNLRQSKRQRVLKGFREKRYRILVATDVASRGIDVPHIRHVINYDLPESAEDYVHRIGRTARGEMEGSAISFITKVERKKWRAIQRFLKG